MDRIVLDAWPVVLFCDFSLELFGRVLVFGVSAYILFIR
jgi:hypothetical protein